MTKEQRFQAMLDQCPVMAKYYNAGEQTIDVRTLKVDFPVKSPGEQIMLAFLKVVWDQGGDWFEGINHFPILEHYARLDQYNERIIAEWTANPYWI